MNRTIRTLITVAVVVGFRLTAYQFTNAENQKIDKAIDAYEAGNYSLAIEKSNQILSKKKVSSQAADIYNLLGLSHFELGELNKSVNAYQKAVELDPQYYQAWVNLGISYRHLEDYDRAEESYQQALAIEPNYANLHISLAALNIVRGDASKAISTLEKAIKLDATIPVAYSNLSVAYAMDSQFEKAEAALQKAVTLGYKNSDVIREEIEYFKSTVGAK